MSHHEPPPGPPEMAHMSFRRKDNSTAFFSHWLTFQPCAPLLPGIFSATRALARVEQTESLIHRFANFALRRGIDGFRLRQRPHR